MRDKPGKAGFNVYKKCYDAGVNIKPTGDALIIAPPFVCEKKDIDEIIDKMRKGISDHLNSWLNLRDTISFILGRIRPLRPIWANKIFQN